MCSPLSSCGISLISTSLLLLSFQHFFLPWHEAPPMTKNADFLVFSIFPIASWNTWALEIIGWSLVSISFSLRLEQCSYFMKSRVLSNSWILFTVSKWIQDTTACIWSSGSTLLELTSLIMNFSCSRVTAKKSCVWVTCLKDADVISRHFLTKAFKLSCSAKHS